MVAIDKPAGLLVHRSMIDRHETRFALQLVRDQIGQRVYPVHRLDKPTSGVLLFALNPDVARLLTDQLTQRQVTKHYKALVRGWPPEQDIIDYPLKEKHDKMTDSLADADKEAQQAITSFVCTKRYEVPVAIGRYPASRFSLLDLQPKTGRKHQLRRHLKHIFHPIIGDTTYGEGRYNRYFREQLGVSRLMLHADQLDLQHPVTGEAIKLVAPIDPIFDCLAAYSV